MATTRKAKTETSDDVVETIEAKQKKSERPIVPKDIDPTQFVTVKNGFHGKLIYRSKRTGEIFEWDDFGDEQEMELRELKNAKNSYKKFFENNYFMFDEPWVIDYLGVRQYYKGALSVNEFSELFSKDPDEIRGIISGMSAGQKKSVSYMAHSMVASGEIDSRKTIAMLEDVLGVELIEK